MHDLTRNGSFAGQLRGARTARPLEIGKTGGGRGEERRSKHAQTKGRGGVRRGDGWRSRAARESERERERWFERKGEKEGGRRWTDGWMDGWMDAWIERERERWGGG